MFNSTFKAVHFESYNEPCMGFRNLHVSCTELCLRPRKRRFYQLQKYYQRWIDTKINAGFVLCNLTYMSYYTVCIGYFYKYHTHNKQSPNNFLRVMSFHWRKSRISFKNYYAFQAHVFFYSVLRTKTNELFKK